MVLVVQLNESRCSGGRVYRLNRRTEEQLGLSSIMKKCMSYDVRKGEKA